MDFSASFDVPVFHTGETAAPPEPGRPMLAEYRAGPADPASLGRAGVDVLPDRPWGARLMRVPRADVAAVRTELAISAGDNRYYRLRLIIAKHVSGQATAEAVAATVLERIQSR